jgi:hypothetical protein
VSNTLAYLSEEIKNATRSEDLEFGGWEPLFEEVEEPNPPKGTATQTAKPFDNKHTKESDQ